MILVHKFGEFKSKLSHSRDSHVQELTSSLYRSVSNPGGSEERENDESEDKKWEKEKTKEKKESESNLRKSFSSSRRRNTEKLPTVFTYQSSQRHAFKEDDNDKNKKKPNAPRYYTSQVTPEQHQPRYLLPRKEDSRTSTSRPNNPTEENISRDVPPENAFLPTFNTSVWAAYPHSVPANVPACLALLHNTDSVLVIQQIDFIEFAFQMDDMPNLYLVQNTNGECLYYAYETSSLFGQFCMRGERTLQIHIMDFYNNEVIYISKTCGSNEFFCCYPVVEIYSPPLQPVGAIFRRPNPFFARFDVVDASEKKIFKIRGRTCCCYGITTRFIEFTIHTVDGNDTEVGVIKREVPIFSFRTGVYGLTFPSDLDVKMKAVLLGAVFFIDYNY